jgi:hypothetical protein
VTEVLAIGEWTDNAHLIADAARLGYITGRVLDLTYGRGKFWTHWRPDVLVTNDLSELMPAQWHHDARKMPFGDGEFETVVFDPPYKLAGARFGDDLDQRYGTSNYSPRAVVHALLLDGTSEAARLSSRWVLVKCMDQVNGGCVRWQTDYVTTHALRLGLNKVDSMMLKRWRPQPEGRRQEHARRNYSTLLVFEKGAR